MPPSLTTTQLYNWKSSGFCRTIPAYLPPYHQPTHLRMFCTQSQILRHKRGPSQYVVRGWVWGQSQAGVGHHQCPVPVSSVPVLAIVESSSRSIQLIPRRCGGNFSHPCSDRGLFYRIILRHCDTLWARTFSISEWLHNNWRAHGVTLDGNISALHREKNCDSTCSHI